MNYKMISNILGWLLIFESMFLAVPMLTAVVYWESTFWAFLGTAAFCLAAGVLITRKKPANTTLYSREGFIIVALSWIILSLFGALPFMLTGVIPSFVDALFEAVSGFSTTGSTIMNDVESAPRSILMWRSFTHWVGGMGVLVFIMAFIPLSGGQNMHIMKAESPGPSVGKLVPHVKTTAMLLYTIYLVMTLAEFVTLLIAGMDAFEALNTAFATAGTGGMGVRNASMGEYAPHIQIIVTVFMALFAINFNTYFFLIHAKFREAFTTEVLVFLGIFAASSAVIALNINSIYMDMGTSVRHSAFTVASIMSTTGFSTEDFNLWPELSRSLIVMLMFVGGCAGSTSGGIKISRILILFKSMGKELEVLIHPKQVKKIKIDGHPIEHEVVRSVNVYMVGYVLVFAVSMVVLSFDNMDLITNFTAVASAINNVGPGLDLVGPASNFSVFSDPVKLVLIFDMLTGRLELFPILLLFSPATWKK
ncbi:MAG: TrkH family potassium uptake protein [Ruminiclostridium sp.]|nr:TrkH family potassium uptake protein [Ruminiclostridium sp.]